MASHVVLIDSTLRRATVKTEPGTYISDILEKGCEKLGLKAEKYTLKHNKKQVDMTRTYRQSGLSSGAKLELVQISRSAAPVSVALQLPESLTNGIPDGRLKSVFSSATTLWIILRKFESGDGRNLNITSRSVAQTEKGASGAGRIFYEQPVCQVMGRELATITDLQKTLASLGFNSGSCMIRLSFRVTATPLEEAMAEITAYFDSVEPKEAEAEASSSKAETTTEVKEISQEPPVVPPKPEPSPDPDTPMPDADDTGAITKAGRNSTNTVPLPSISSANSTLLGPGNRPMTVFSAPTDSTPRAATQQVNDADYVPTLAHVALHGTRIKSESRNKRLPTDAEAKKHAEEKAAKQAAIKSVEVKLRFPDQTSANASFTNTDTANDLYDFAQGLLREGIRGESFTLGWMGEKGPRVVPRGGAEKLISNLGFVGRVLVNFHWGDGVSGEVRKGPVLKTEYVHRAQDITVPEIPNVEEDGKGDEGKGKQKENSGGNKSGSDEAGLKKAMPKWFKGLTKK